MRVAINCRSILKEHRTGIGRYTYHLIDALSAFVGQDKIILHTPKHLLDIKRHLPLFSHQQYIERMDYFNLGVRDADVYHLPSPYVLGPMQGKLVVTVHDLIHRTFAQSHTKETIALTEGYLKDIVAKADHIICTSACTREDLHRYFKFPKERSSVVYNGVDHAVFYPLKDEERLSITWLSLAGITRPFILFVGTIEPRKNLAGLLEAFAVLKTEQVLDVQMVVVGMKGWMMEEMASQIKKLGLERDIVFTGVISDAQLRELYNLAEIFVYPSFYEGFGFPIVEAFSCGVPVITSKTSSCGEIAADAAMTIDPANIEEMIEAMMRLLKDKTLREDFRQRGLKRVRDFSFKKNAQETWAIYKEICS